MTSARETIDVGRFQILNLLVAKQRKDVSSNATAIDIQRTGLLWTVSLSKDEPFVGRGEVTFGECLYGECIPTRGALLGGIIALNGLSECGDRKLACLFSRDCPVPPNLHAPTDAARVSIVDEIRAASARSTNTPKPFSSLHQMVNCFARGTAASTMDFVSLGIR